MSRTDKTRPWRVRAQDCRLVERHDHSTHPCDLPERWQFGWRRGSCYWEAPSLYFPSRDWGCGCPKCTDQEGRRSKRRRERREAKRLAREGGDGG